MIEFSLAWVMQVTVQVALDILETCDCASERVMSGSTPEADNEEFLDWKKNGLEKF